MCRKKIFVVFSLIIASAFGSAFFVNPLAQKENTNQNNEVVKLKYHDIPLLDDYSPPNIPPIVLSPNRLLVPAGDKLYLLDSNKRVVWARSITPNIILDVAFDGKDRIYVAQTDGIFRVLDLSGKEIWGHFMNGRANYSQIKPYKDGVLVVVDMRGYRTKEINKNIGDLLEFRKADKMIWSKHFPINARLQIWGDKIFAVKQTKEGIELKDVNGVSPLP